MNPTVTEERLRSEPDRWLRVGEVVLDLEGLVVYVGDGRVALTYREFLVLRALMARAGRTVGRAEILDAAWGDRPPRLRMVDVYVRRVRSRLGDRVAADGGAPLLEQHIRAVRGEGYVFDVPGRARLGGEGVGGGASDAVGASDDDGSIPRPRPATGA